MSILKQNYIVEDHNGDAVEYNGNIYKLVEKYREGFRQVFGVAFNLRKLPRDVYRWDRTRESYYILDVRQKGREIEYDRVKRSWLWQASYDYYRRGADCQYIIRDGFGRVVHPDVIYQAYLKEFGALKTKFDQGSSYYQAYFRGKKASCYGSYRKINSKRYMRDAIYADLNIDGEPPLRRNKKLDAMRDIWWSWDDGKVRQTQRSWKKQTKVKKQWMKRK